MDPSLNHCPKTELLVPNPLHILSFRLPPSVILSISTLPILLVVVLVLKYERGRLLHVNLRDRPDQEHPYLAIVAVLTWQPLCSVSSIAFSS